MKRSALKKALAATLCSVVVGGFATQDLAAAAEADEDSTEASSTKKPGYYTESFHILPEVQLTGYYDDNIYATDQQQVSDYVAILSPMLKIKSLWKRHSLKLDAGANLGRYDDNAGEDYNDAWAEVDGTYDVGDKTSLFGGAGYSKKHEPRDSKESARLVTEPTTYNVTDLRLGLRQGLGDLTLRVAGTYQALDYDNVGLVYNDDRDRTVTGLGARVSKLIDKRLSVYVQGFLNKRDYDEAYDQLGYDRDSQGYTASVGFTKGFARNGRINAYLGWLAQEYDDPRFHNVSEPNFAASLRWYPAESYKLTASVDRTLSETTEEGSSGYLYTKLDLQLDKRMFNNIVGYLSYGYGLAEYQDIGREDVMHSFGLGVNYYMTQQVLISGGISHLSNDSNDQTLYGLEPGDTYDYERNLVLLSIKVKFSP